MTLLDDGLLAAVREIVDLTHGHTYTRIPRVAGARTAWGTTPLTPGTPQVGRACTYVNRDDIDTRETGVVVRQTPPLQVSNVYREVLYLPWDDDLAKDDQVANVLDPDGRLLLIGPVPVIDVLNHAGFGAVTGRVAILRGPIEEVPTP